MLRCKRSVTGLFLFRINILRRTGADPFYRYKVKHIDPKVPHLSAEELKRIEEKEISIRRLDQVRDIFVFTCYTGFAYIDVVKLTTSHLKTGIDGKQWLIKDRQKTGISERVRILPSVARILDKYKGFFKFRKAKSYYPFLPIKK